jgi:excisionase family DNA binding protein
MRDNGNLLTTGDIARYCGVSRMGVIRWIQQGKIKAHSTPGGHYRVRLSDFHAFLAAFDMPVDRALFSAVEEPRRAVVVSGDPVVLGAVGAALAGRRERWLLEMAASEAALGRLLDSRADLVVIDPRAPLERAVVDGWLASQAGGPAPAVVLLPGDDLPNVAALRLAAPGGNDMGAHLTAALADLLAAG